MGVTLERVQFKFASIIGELCSEPRVLSQFAVWLDLRLAEYKLKGSISLECSNAKPDPTWLNGIKDEEMPKEEASFSLSTSKSRRKPQRNTSFSPIASVRTPPLTVDAEVTGDTLIFPGIDRGIHPADISENISDSGTQSHVACVTDVIGLRGENCYSTDVVVKQEHPDGNSTFPVTLVPGDRQSSAITTVYQSNAIAGGYSTNRRKRQPTSIIRNSCSHVTGSGFVGSVNLDDDSQLDNLYSPNQSKSPRLAGKLTSTLSSESLPKESESLQNLPAKNNDFAGDRSSSLPVTSQTEGRAAHSDGDQQSSRKGEKSTDATISEQNLSWYGGGVGQDYVRRYARGNRMFLETPEQKKLRMRELAKMRQRRCRERQRIRRLLAADSASFLNNTQLRAGESSQTST